MKTVAILLPTSKKYGRQLTGTLAKLEDKTEYEGASISIFFDADPLGFRELDPGAYGRMKVTAQTNGRIVERVGAINILYAAVEGQADLYITWMPDADPWKAGWLTRAVAKFEEEFSRGAGLLELRPEIIMFNAKFVRLMDLPAGDCIPANYIRYNWDREMIARAKLMECYAKGEAPRRRPEEIDHLSVTHIRVNDNIVFNRRKRNRDMAEGLDEG